MAGRSGCGDCDEVEMAAVGLADVEAATIGRRCEHRGTAGWMVEYEGGGNEARSGSELIADAPAQGGDVVARFAASIRIVSCCSSASLVCLEAKQRLVVLKIVAPLIAMLASLHTKSWRLLNK